MKISSYKDYIKTSDKPMVDDYVICDDSLPEVSEFVNNSIGVIVMLEHDKNGNIEYVVEYDNIPEDIISEFEHKYYGMGNGYGYCRNMLVYEIIYWSKNKEDVEEYLTEKKYNL